jgi:hypothetical protein
MKKMATKKAAYGGTKPMMKSGGKKMAGGGKVASKKKYMVGGATEQCGPGDPNCKEGNYSKGRGTGKPKMGIGQRIKNVLSGSTSKKVKVKK